MANYTRLERRIVVVVPIRIAILRLRRSATGTAAALGLLFRLECKAEELAVLAFLDPPGNPVFHATDFALAGILRVIVLRLVLVAAKNAAVWVFAFCHNTIP